jgi:hypothetical protein
LGEIRADGSDYRDHDDIKNTWWRPSLIGEDLSKPGNRHPWYTNRQLAALNSLRSCDDIGVGQFGIFLLPLLFFMKRMSRKEQTHRAVIATPKPRSARTGYKSRRKRRPLK